MFGSCIALALPSSHTLLHRWSLGSGPSSMLVSSWKARYPSAGRCEAALPLGLMGSSESVVRGAQPRQHALDAEFPAGGTSAAKPDMFWGSATAAYQVCRQFDRQLFQAPIERAPSSHMCPSGLAAAVVTQLAYLCSRV